MSLGNNQFSHCTAKERDKLSFPASILLSKNLMQGKILDFGCGHGSDVAFLREKSFDVVGYDPHYAPNYPSGKFDTIICIYVLNVLEKIEQSDVLMNVSQLLKPGGKAYFAVRRDISFEGFRTHKIHKKKTYQVNVQLPFESVFKNDFSEIFEYQHYNYSNPNGSPFFLKENKRDMIFESATAFSIWDKFPVNRGHALVIPKRVVKNYFELDFHEQQALWLMANKLKKLLDKLYKPSGYNVGINVNESAGQTIDHVHIHIIPRYSGDIENPRGGVRGIIPEKKEY